MLPKKIRGFRDSLKRNNTISILCLLSVLTCFVLNSLERREAQRERAEYAYYVAADGEVIPAHYAARRDNIEIEIRHHLAMFVDAWYNLTQYDWEEKAERAGVFERTKTVVAEVVPSVVENSHPQPSPVPSNDTSFDEAYREIERNMKEIYGNSEPQVQQTAGQPSASTTPVASAADRRRSALLRDWGMNGRSSADASPVAPAMFRAVIHGTQLLKAGQVALFRTKEPIRYGSLVVPANTLLSGVALIAENRLTIKITSVRLGQQVFALPLEVYGSDGMAGLPLDGDVVDRVAGEQTSSTAIRETGAAASRYGGTIGRVAGALISGVGNQVRSAKNTEVKLIDNQIVILKISEQ